MFAVEKKTVEKPRLYNIDLEGQEQIYKRTFANAKKSSRLYIYQALLLLLSGNYNSVKRRWRDYLRAISIWKGFSGGRTHCSSAFKVLYPLVI